jgi:hypothetical protein
MFMNISGLAEPFDVEFEAILSIAGNRVGNSEAFASVLASVAHSRINERVSDGVDAAEPRSGFWAFAAAWCNARK